jgi:glycosyltransferase involved in cell wall biosynthesis
MLPGSELLILGKGALLEDVRRFAAANPGVRLLVDPSRPEIFACLSAAKALILFSQPQKGFKEQVGLPIVEGLSFGCEIVSSDETGIASWLHEHGHQVVESGANDEELAQAVIRAITSTRTRAELLEMLPATDGRLCADYSLFRERE